MPDVRSGVLLVVVMCWQREVQVRLIAALPDRGDGAVEVERRIRNYLRRSNEGWWVHIIPITEIERWSRGRWSHTVPMSEIELF